jgi:glycosyltransferase involved in cell wall biosynthesis
VVVPAFNEEACIGAFIDRMRAELIGLAPSWEILVVDDGSDDRTVEVVEAWARDDSRVRLVRGEHRGKGAAVRRDLLEARGAWRFMADADLSMPPENLRRFLDAVSGTEPPAIVIGSREAPGALRVGEPWTRHVIGRLFNWIVRLLAVAGVQDTQCGYKLFSAKAVDAVCPHLTVDGFAFDVELLFLAQRAGLGVREVGIRWNFRADSRVAVGRGAAAFLDILRIRWRAARGAYAAAPRSAGSRVAGLECRTWAYLVAAVFALTIGADLLRMPVQVYDAIGEILDAQRSPSAWASFWGSLSSDGYLRPLRIAQIKLLFDVSGGDYWLAYRGFHALLLACCFFLFTRALDVRTTTDLAAALVALTVLTGLHTFRTTVQEAFPINHFLEVGVFALIAINLARSRGGILTDAAALLTFAVAALTLESGLLVWVVAVAAWTFGMRGISARGVAAMTALVAGYFYLRFVLLPTGAPEVGERSAGYLLGVLEPDELQRRFSDRLFWFYGYNVMSSMLSVLLSEPQSGIFLATRSWLQGEVPPRVVLAFLSSTVTTGLIGWAAIRGLRQRTTGDGSLPLIPVFVAVLGASAVLSYAYTKDDIMSTAGMFYALAAYAAVRLLLGRAARMRHLTAGVLACVLLVAGTAWSVRSLGIHHILQSQAFKHRNDWAALPGLWQRAGTWPADPRQQALIGNLRSAALATRTSNPRFEPRWAFAVWGD